MIRNLLVAGAVFFGAAAFAQATPSTGTATVRGTVSPAVSLFYGSSDFTGVNTFGAVETAPAPDSALTYIADFGDIANPGVAGFQRVLLNLHLRSNVDYQVNATYQDNILVAPFSVLSANDIGFAIKNVSWDNASPRIAPRGPLAATIPDGVAAANDEVNQTFFVPAVNGTEPTPGVPSYTATLGMLSTNVALPTTLLEGPQVSSGGSFGTTDNMIEIATEFAILPQLLATSGSFDYTVTFTAIQL